MSAYIISHRNFDFILSYLQDKRCSSLYLYLGDGETKSVCFDHFHQNYDKAECERVMQILADQNVESFNARYPKHAEETEKYTFKSLCTERVLGEKNKAKLAEGKEAVFKCKTTMALGILDCYEYQCDVLPSYEDSIAAGIVTQIRAFAISNLPGISDCWGV